MEPLSVHGGRHDCCSAPAIAAPVAHSVRACQHRLPHALAQTSWVSQGGEWPGWSGGKPCPSIEPSAGGRLAKVTAQPSSPGVMLPRCPYPGRGKTRGAYLAPLPKRGHQPRPLPRPRARGRSLPGNGLSFPIDRSAGAAVMAPVSMPPMLPSAAKTAEQRSPRGGSEQPKPKSRRIACQYGSHSGGSQTGDRTRWNAGTAYAFGGREPWPAAWLLLPQRATPSMRADACAIHREAAWSHPRRGAEGPGMAGVFRRSQWPWQNSMASPSALHI